MVIVPTFAAWQAAARELLREGVEPDQVRWEEAPAPSGDRAPDAAPTAAPAARVPRAFLDLAPTVVLSDDAGRWTLLYRVLWRLVHERRDLLDDEADPDVRHLRAIERAWREAPVDAGGAESFVPAHASLAELAIAAARCRGCDLFRPATQAVFGRGPADARVVLVGEQPGDQEDRQGAPFVGPAGEVLDRALLEVGLDRERLYVTNVVKHFKFVSRGKRRIHQTPRLPEIVACQPWMAAELAAVAPSVLVCLGATAARALLGADFRLMQSHGKFLASRWAHRTLATLHPSAVLRGEDDAAKARLYAMLRDDLRLVAAAVAAA